MLFVYLLAVGVLVTEDEVVCEIEPDKVPNILASRAQCVSAAQTLVFPLPDLSSGPFSSHWCHRGAAGA